MTTWFALALMGGIAGAIAIALDRYQARTCRKAARSCRELAIESRGRRA